MVEEVPVICGVHATDPRRRMWHWLQQVKEMGFSGVNNFPTHTIVDGQFRQVLEETGMSVKKNSRWLRWRGRWTCSRSSMWQHRDEAAEMAKAGADAIIAHVGTTIGGSIGVRRSACTMDEAVRRTQAIIEAARQVRKDIFFLPRRPDRHARRRRLCESAHRLCRLCWRFQPGAYGRRAISHDLTRRFKQIQAPAAKLLLGSNKTTKVGSRRRR